MDSRALKSVIFLVTGFLRLISFMCDLFRGGPRNSDNLLSYNSYIKGLIGMSRTRKNYPSHMKAKVALSAIREDRTISELSSEFGIHATVIHCWKKEALDGIEDRFKQGSEKSQKEHALEIKELHAKIGELTIEKDFLEQASKTLGLGGVKK